MEKYDYVICSWCKIDDTPDFEYNYLCAVTHNQAVDEAKFYSDQQTLCGYKDLIYQELEKCLGADNGFAVSGFADIYEEIMNEFQRFEVWKVNSNISKEAYDEFDFNPDIFCNRYCERVA